MSVISLFAVVTMLGFTNAAALNSSFVPRQLVDCPATTDDGTPVIAKVGIYSDKDCTTTTGAGFLCAAAGQEVIDDGPGHWVCESGAAPTNRPWYAKVLQSDYSDIQLIYTMDQSCPPSGPGAVFATLIDNSNCVEMNDAGTAVGLTVYPHGGAAVSKKLRKRDPSCSGFNIDSSEPSESPSVQVSNIINCINADTNNGCTIGKGEQYTESLAASFTLSGGIMIPFTTSVEATFGVEYTNSSTTSTQENYSVAQGQAGYLASYNTATLFKGTFTGCDSGDAEQPGESLVLKKNGLVYNVVYTGSASG